MLPLLADAISTQSTPQVLNSYFQMPTGDFRLSPICTSDSYFGLNSVLPLPLKAAAALRPSAFPFPGEMILSSTISLDRKDILTLIS